MRATVTALLGLALLLVSGCEAGPFDAETRPPLTDFGIRITEGVGAADPYLDSVSVLPPSTVQFRMRVADGEAAEVRLPRGPAESFTAVAREDGEDRVLGQVSIRSTTAADLRVGTPYSLDPGYVSVEDHSTDEEVIIRIATPRLLDAAQGAIPVSFKVDLAATPRPST